MFNAVYNIVSHLTFVRVALLSFGAIAFIFLGAFTFRTGAIMVAEVVGFINFPGDATAKALAKTLVTLVACVFLLIFTAVLLVLVATAP